MATLKLSLISETIGMYDGVWNKQFKLIKKSNGIPEEEQVFTLRNTFFSTYREIAKTKSRPRIEIAKCNDETVISTHFCLPACQDRFSQEAKLCNPLEIKRYERLCHGFCHWLRETKPIGYFLST